MSHHADTTTTFGYPQVHDPNLALLDEAVRMLPNSAGAVAVDISGGILHVVADHIPAPAEYEMWEKHAGLPVTLSLAHPDIFEQIRSRAEAMFIVGVPRAAGIALTEAASANATDVSLVAGAVPQMRIGGEFTPVPQHPVLTEQDVDAATHWLLGSVVRPADGAATWADARWRASAYTVEGRPALIVRRLAKTIPRLEDLGVPAHVVELARAEAGLVVIAGPSASGKSTTAAALVDRINTTRQGHIVTLEPVIEYRHRSRACVMTQQTVQLDTSAPGADVATYADGIRQASRHGADVIVVGDLSDAAAVEAAVTAAESGQLVIATTSATSAASAIHRLLSAYPASAQETARARLSEALLAVVNQRLIAATGAAARGDRQLVCEVILSTPAVRTVLRDGRVHELAAITNAATGEGMTSMDRSLALYAAAERIDHAAARRLAPNQDRFDLYYRSAPGAGSTEAGKTSGRNAAQPEGSLVTPGVRTSQNPGGVRAHTRRGRARK